MSTSSLPVVERLLFLLMLSFASVMAKRSPLLHSIGSSRMAADKKGKEGKEGISLSSSMRTGVACMANNHSIGGTCADWFNAFSSSTSTVKVYSTESCSRGVWIY